MDIISWWRPFYRINLGLTRDVPILRMKRAATGTNIRGSKPVTVYFQKYEDKEEILRYETLCVVLCLSKLDCLTVTHLLLPIS